MYGIFLKSVPATSNTFQKSWDRECLHLSLIWFSYLFIWLSETMNKSIHLLGGVMLYNRFSY